MFLAKSFGGAAPHQSLIEQSRAGTRLTDTGDRIVENTPVWYCRSGRSSRGGGDGASRPGRSKEW